MSTITDKLFSLQDIKYRDFHCRLVPTVGPERIIGVRVPDVRKYADELYKSGEYIEFINTLPHYYYEENNLHAFLIEKIKNYDECITELERFLPYVDNWATCDSMRPKVLEKNREAILKKIDEWLASDHVYTIRFGIEVLMNSFHDRYFVPEHPEKVSLIVSDEYYVNMMIAWYFATGLAKQYDSFLPYIEQHRLSPVVEKMTVRKACESFRVSEDQKAYLKSVKVK